MKERILVTYFIQNTKQDSSKNCFFMVVDNPKRVKVRDVLDNFPPRKNDEFEGKAYHIRFLDCFGGINFK